MQTRPGDLDPGAAGFARRVLGLDLEAYEAALNRDSGMAALTGERDMRTILERARSHDAEAMAALDAYAYRAAKYVGAYAVALGGLDALSFTGGVGEHARPVRERICDRLVFLGVTLDPGANRRAQVKTGDATDVSASPSAVRTLVIGADEQRVIARHVAVLASADASGRCA